MSEFVQTIEAATMEMEKMEMKNLDFISELPDPVLHHILSFIDMFFIVRTSILSKRWRYLWRSTHFLNFNEELFNTSTATTQLITNEAEPTSKYLLEKKKEDPFMEFVNQVLSLHCKSDINTFSISGVDPRVPNQTGLSRSKYDPWLAIRRDAEDSENRRTLVLPSCFFNSNTLTTLKLDMGSKRGRQIFKIPDLGSVDLPCLKTLHLGSVLLVDGDSIGGFFSRCLGLETLIISNCLLEEKNNLSIYGLQLKYLELGISCVKSTCIGENGKVTVCAPNLESFLCRDLLLSEFYFDLENASALLNADLDFCLASSPACLCQISLDYSPQREEEYVQNVLKCLRSVCNVKSLSLYMGLFKGTLQDHSSFQGLLNPFCNLRVLLLKTLFFKEHILNIAVLEMCPYLQTLILEWTSGPVARPLDKIYSKRANIVDEFWEVKAPLHCLSHNLQFVEIRCVHGTLDEFKFLRFLMKNAMMLVKLNLVTSSVCRSQPYFKGCLQTFLEKFAALPIASSSVEISVVPQH